MIPNSFLYPLRLAICLAFILSSCYATSTLAENTVTENPVLTIHPVANLPRKVKETSGLATNQQILWTINDSGDKAKIYGFDKSKFHLTKTLLIENAHSIDWETLAQDEEYLYIGDCGNNGGQRDKLTLYKVKWQAITTSRNSVAADKIDFFYADKPDKPIPKLHNFDCEAITTIGSSLWLFSKNRGNAESTVYQLDKNQHQQILKPLQSLKVGGLITAADYHIASEQLVLVGYNKTDGWGSSFVWRIPFALQDQVIDISKAQRFELNPLGQWEAVLWLNDKEVLISSERNPFGKQRLGKITFP